MGAKISVHDFLLVLNGWREAKRPVRAVLSDFPVQFAAFGTIYGVNDNGFSVSIDALNMIAASVEGCECGFMDLPEGEAVLGKPVESGLVAVRTGFRLVIMLLRE
jgi:hypothetical protein